MKTLVGILFASVLASRALLAAADAPAAIEKGTQVGVINLLSAELLHYHSAKAFKDTFLTIKPVGWPIQDMLDASVREPLGRLGLEAVPIAAPQSLRHVSEDCFVNAALVRGLPKKCSPALVETAASAGVKFLIVMAPGFNNPDHTGSRQAEDGLSERLRGWGFYTSERGGPHGKPVVFSETELLLIQITPAGATLAARQWGGIYRLNWETFSPPADLKEISPDALNELQPLFAAILSRQTADLLGQVRVSP